MANPQAYNIILVGFTLVSIDTLTSTWNPEPKEESCRLMDNIAGRRVKPRYAKIYALTIVPLSN